MTHTELCHSLVRSGPRIIRDGGDYSQSANRCIAGGVCVGYYAVLIAYDESSDRFTTGHNQGIDASCVDEVKVFDAICGLARQ